MYNITPHTIFLTIGPSNCGKTYFCKNVLMPQIQKLKPLPNRKKESCCYVSSDDIRRMLTNQDFDKNDFAMMAASKEAFEVLYRIVDSATSFPVNSEFVIVDTKGTNEKFRNRILEIAQKNNYQVAIVIFNYKNFEDYAAHGDLNKHISIDIRRTRELARSGLKKLPQVKQVVAIKSPDFSNCEDIFSFDKHELYSKCILNNNKQVVVISDIHGCYDELLELLAIYEIKVDKHKIVSNPKDYEIVINGDFIDKGPKTFDVIDFCYENLDILKIVTGNHENRLYKELYNNLEHISEPWFDTYEVIDEEHKDKFKAIFEASLPFVMNDKFIATHAPAAFKYLGKIDGKSQARQRYYLKKNEETLYEELMNDNLLEDSQIVHVFGHVPVSNPGYVFNKHVLADGACCLGGELVAVEISYYGKAYIKCIASKQKKDPELNDLPIFKIPQNEKVDLSLLQDGEIARVKYMMKDNINFISGTMSPCDKADGKLESIESAMDFFKSNGVTDIVMQPKYMGSRMNMYLFEDNDKCFSISRNGFKIKIDGLESLYDKMRLRLKDFINWENVELVIIDGECMPWSAIGEGLIKDFRTVSDNLKAENEFLKESGFESKLVELKAKYDSSDFNTDKNETSKKDLISKYGDYTYRVFSAFSKYKHIPIEEREKMRLVYDEQLHIYGSAGELDYKPFSILKIVKKDGTEESWYLEASDMTNETMFNLLNEDSCFRYNLNNPDDIEACKKQFEKYTVEDKYEGVVIKPNNLMAKRVPPYMKVRNPNYLTIIYGYDHTDPDKYAKLYERKTINSKLKLSKTEWYKGLDMLRVKYHDVPNSEIIKNLFASFILEDKKEEGIDPRL